MTQVENYSPRRARRSSAQHGQGTGASGPNPPGPGDHDPGGGPHQRRGSHATIYGQGFSWVLVWTIVGALIPGTGLIASGSRRLGAFLLFLLGLGLAAVAAFALVGDGLKRALSLAVDSQKLLIAAVVVGVIALIWAGIILLTHSRLRRYATLTGGQRLFSGVVVLGLVAAVALPAYKLSSYALLTRDVIGSITSADSGDGSTGATPNVKKADPWATIPRINVLLIGSDAGRGREGTRPDTMIVASIDTRSGNTVLFSLPRGLEHAPFPPGTGGAQAFPNGFYCPQDACLLNAVWAWAEQAGHQYYAKYKNPGLKATEDAIQGVTGLKIDTYASLNLKGFQQFVDAMGGVTVNVHERLPIGGNSHYRVAVGGYIEIGNRQHLDGYHALWFARSRWASDDFHRMRRQRCVIGAVVSQANPTKMVKQFPALAAAAKNNISTGIRPNQLQAWLTLALRIKDAKVTSLPFDDKVVTNRVNPDFPMIQSLVRKAISDSTTPQAAPTTTAPVTGVTPGSTPSTGASATPKPSKTTADPLKAQSLKDVC